MSCDGTKEFTAVHAMLVSDVRDVATIVAPRCGTNRLTKEAAGRSDWECQRRRLPPTCFRRKYCGQEESQEERKEGRQEGQEEGLKKGPRRPEGLA